MFYRCHYGMLPLFFIYTCNIKVVTSRNVMVIPASEYEVDPRTSFKMACKVESKSGVCIWFKDYDAIPIIEAKYVFNRRTMDGDCSIVINDTLLDSDDGVWQCQLHVAFPKELTFKFPEVRVIVREVPFIQTMDADDVTVNLLEPMTVFAGSSKRFKCTARKGNPPVALKWVFDEKEISSNINQINEPDPLKEKTWMTTLAIDFKFQRTDNKKKLKCIATHNSFETKLEVIDVKLDVLYPPKIRLKIGPKGKADIIEGTRVALKCLPDANPPAKVIWRKAGHLGNYRLIDEINFNPIMKTDSGNYTCSARNDIGQSEMEIRLDVKYPPKVRVEGGPRGNETIREGTRLALKCIVDANPRTIVIWRKSGHPGIYDMTENIAFNPITRNDLGVFSCSATNSIGKSNEVKITLDVTYAPEVRFAIEPRDKKDIVEGTTVVLKCLIDANPRAKVTLNKSGYSGIYTTTNQIRFNPINRNNSGVFSCSAKNDMGESRVVETTLDVKYKPKILRIYPPSGTTVRVYQTIKFICEAEGNPLLRYSWLQRIAEDPRKWEERAAAAMFTIHNVSYDFQGNYICQASNMINGILNVVRSDEIYLYVTKRSDSCANCRSWNYFWAFIFSVSYFLFY